MLFLKYKQPCQSLSVCAPPDVLHQRMYRRASGPEGISQLSSATRRRLSSAFACARPTLGFLLLMSATVKRELTMPSFRLSRGSLHTDLLLDRLEAPKSINSCFGRILASCKSSPRIWEPNQPRNFVHECHLRLQPLHRLLRVLLGSSGNSVRRLHRWLLLLCLH